MIIEGKSRQLQMPTDGRKANHQRDDHAHHRRVLQRNMKSVIGRGVHDTADNTGRGIDFRA